MKKVIILIIILIVLAVAGYFILPKITGLVNRQDPISGETTSETEDVIELPEYIDPFPDDKDRDGLTNEEEAILGTSEIEFDTDGDGLSDIDEINYWKTDPLKTDTDGDGYSDSWEILGGYNPNGEGVL